LSMRLPASTMCHYCKGLLEANTFAIVGLQVLGLLCRPTNLGAFAA
jgi:hypothetical protein